MVYPSTQTVTQPGTNLVWRSATTLIEANALPLSQTAKLSLNIIIIIIIIIKYIYVAQDREEATNALDHSECWSADWRCMVHYACLVFTQP